MKKKALMVLAVIIVFFFGIFVFRLFFPEDDWVCRDGVWIQHGNPQNPAPADECQKSY